MIEKVLFKNRGYLKKGNGWLAKKFNVTEVEVMKAKKQLQNVNRVNYHFILPDVHVPGHNKNIVNGIINVLDKYATSVSSLVFIGDFLDLNSLSSHDKGKFTAIPGLTLQTEYQEGNDLLDKFDSVLLDKTKKVFMYGNHEQRAFSYNSDLENGKRPVQLPHNALNLKARGYDILSNWKEDSYMIGPYQLIHGIYTSNNALKQHMEALRTSVIYGHTHKILSHVEDNIESHNIGYLGDKNSPIFNYADRLSKNKWKNGFAVILEYNKKFQFQQIICNNNSFIFNGEIY